MDCNSSFQDLNRHINGIHKSQKEIPSIIKYYQGKSLGYKCSLCSFKDVSKNSLAHHISSVHEENIQTEENLNPKKRFRSPERSDLESQKKKKVKVSTDQKLELSDKNPV